MSGEVANPANTSDSIFNPNVLILTWSLFTDKTIIFPSSKLNTSNLINALYYFTIVFPLGF